MFQQLIINNAQDLIEALRNNSDLREEAARLILTDKLLAVPEQLALLTSNFQQFVSHTTEAFNAVHARMDALERGQEQIKEIALNALEGSGRALAVATEARDIATEARDRATEARDMAIQASRNSRRALGPSYERHVKPKLARRCATAFGIDSPKIIMDALNEPTPEFHSLIQKALNDGLLTADDNESLQEADFVLAAQGNRHVIVEASLTLDERDIRRASQRAAILSQATQGQAHAAVATEEIGPGQRALAEDLNVAIFQIEM